MHTSSDRTGTAVRPPSTTARPLVTLEHVTKVFVGRRGEQTTVLDDVTFSVGRGEIFAVVGPSGSGKSTLAKCINLLERPTHGSVVIDGADLTAVPEHRLHHARAGIGTIFQSSSLLLRKNARQNIALPLRFAGWPAKRIDARVSELLDLVGLADKGTLHPRQLSGGQRQRVGIARALALNPSVLLSDEATSGLDPEITLSILDLIKRLRDELDLAVVMITHEMEAVRPAATHVALIEHGRITETGPVGVLSRDPGSLLGRSLFPLGSIGAGAADTRRFVVRYVGADVRIDWIQVLGARLGITVGVLGGEVETVNGAQAGHLVIAVSSEVRLPELSAVLDPLGLDIRPFDIDGTTDGNVSA